MEHQKITNLLRTTPKEMPDIPNEKFITKK